MTGIEIGRITSKSVAKISANIKNFLSNVPKFELIIDTFLWIIEGKLVRI
jgi:hypothetical protein